MTELAFVLAVMGIIISIAAPASELLVRRARSDEARSLLVAISNAELQRFRDRGAFLACPAAGDVPRAPTSFSTSECWRELGVVVSGEVRYRYGVELVDGTFHAVAEGDLDGDGVPSRFVLDGRTQRLDIHEALE